MRVFTQRFVFDLFTEYGHTNPNHWNLPNPGDNAVWDSFWASFTADHPTLAPQGVHELDYTIVCSPTMYITGKYWGDETTLAAATDFVQRRNAIFTAPVSSVFTCDDNQHPADLPIAGLLNSLGRGVDAMTYEKVGYYRAHDPDTLVSVP